MASRTTLTSLTPGAITGDDYMDNVAAHLATMYTGLPLTLITIAGTANDVTAAVDPALNLGLIANMSFWFTAAATNTGPMTMKIGAEPVVAMVNPAGAALVAGEVVSGTTYLLYFNGTSLQVRERTPLTETGAVLRYDVFTASGNLNKPADFPDDGLVIIEAWAGGGGGHNGAGGGGGGGGFSRGVFRGADLGAAETVTIGAGGSTGQPGAAGGNTSVGALLIAYGGGGGSTNDTGGGGGGQISAGGAANGTNGGAGGRPFPGGSGSSANCGGGATGGIGGDGIFGGGGGGATTGGNSLLGGGGGGDSAGGVSVFGGNGGATGASGAIPGGGGGIQGGNGARGEVRVRWIG